MCFPFRPNEFVECENLLMTYHLQSKEHKYAIRRLMVQRILYSEIGAFEKVKAETTNRLHDIGQTLAFFNYTVPAMISTCYALYVEGKEVWRNRQRIDYLAFVYPVGIYFINRLMEGAREVFLKFSKKGEKKEKVQKKMTVFIANTIDGLCDIQINNLQGQEMKRLDTLIGNLICNQLLFYEESNRSEILIEYRGGIVFTQGNSKLH